MTKVMKKIVVWISIFAMMFGQIGSYSLTAYACEGFWFTKTNATGTVSLQGAQFALVQGDNVKYTATSDASGKVSFSALSPGTYTLKETKAPDGYLLSNETHVVVVSGSYNITIDGNSYSSFNGYKFKDTAISNGFSFKKTNGDGTKRLGGAVFGLYDGDTVKYTATSLSDGTGIVTFTNIAPGTYTLKETTPPTGYDLSTETHAVVVAADGSIQIDGADSGFFTKYKFKDTMKTNQFSFTKTDETGTIPLAGAVFELREGGVAKYTATSGADGKVVFKDLAPGTYIMVEVTAPNGYELSDERINVHVKDDLAIFINSVITPPEFESYKYKDKKILDNEFTFTKTNADGTVNLAGAVFGLYQGTSEVYTATSAADGKVTFSDIAVGTYTLKEKTAPTGYQKSSETHTVVVAPDKSITIDGSAASAFAGYKFKDTRKPNGFQFLKTNSNGTKTLAGAVFGLYQGTTEVYTATSAADGTVTFSNIEPGTYTLKEKTPPAGYMLSAEAHTVTVTADMTLTVDWDTNTGEISTMCIELYKFKDQPNGFKFIKTNADGTKTLTGAVFGLYQGASEVYTATSAADGTVVFAKIAPGTYTLKEKTAPTGYQVSGETHAVVVAADGSIQVDGKASADFAGYKFKDTKTPNGFKFIKTNADGTKTLAGAVFGLYKGTTEVYTATSSADGTVMFSNLEPGTYTLKEKTAPTGYQKSSETHTVVVASDRSIQVDGKPSADFAGYKFKDKRKPNGFQFLKTNEKGTVNLAGAVFGLYQGTTEVYTATSAADGTVTFSNIEPGTYTLKEKTAPIGYVLSTEAHIVTVKDDMTLTVDWDTNVGEVSLMCVPELYKFKNTKIPNDFKFIKTNADGTKTLAGAVFGLYKGMTEVYTATSSADGTVMFSNLEPGTYTLKEKTAPTGYQKSSETHTVVVASDRSIQVDGKPSADFAGYKFKDTRKPNGFQFLKTNEKGTVNLAGAVFGLYQGTTEVYTATSAADGTVTFNNIEPGTYTLKEKTPPAGYMLSSEAHIVTVTADMTLTVDWDTNVGEVSLMCVPELYKFKDQPNDFKFIKTNADGTKTLAGAVFGLYKGTTEAYTATSDANGTVSFSKIAPGTYTLKEKTAPTGYQKSSETHTVVVAADGSITIDGKPSADFAGYKFKDKRKPNGFQFLKTNEKGTVNLAGAVFGLYQGTTEVYTATSAADGTVTFSNIEPGTYTLKEKTAPVGYVLSTEAHIVTVTADMTLTVDWDTNVGEVSLMCVPELYKFKNTKIPNGFKFIKTNADGTKTLAGAVFGLYQGTTEVYTATSAADGTVTFSDLNAGTYTLKEKTAPTGYQKSGETHTVVVAADRSIQVDGKPSADFAGYKFKDTRKPNGFKFLKTNAKGTVNLAGAVFGLYQGTTEVYTATSAADGTVTFNNIEPGTYTLKEKTPPAGYMLSSEAHIVTVKDDMTLTIDWDTNVGEVSLMCVPELYKFKNQPNDFKFIKTNADGTKTLAGAVFGLYKGTTEAYTATSDANGTVSFSKIAPGTYTLKEKTAPTGYQKSSETHTVVVAADGSITIDGKPSADFAGYKFKDKRKPNGFKFLKTNAKGTVNLAGAVFGLYQGTTEVYTATSAADGTVTFNNIEPGTYTLKEKTPPAGYMLSTEAHIVTVTADMTLTVDWDTNVGEVSLMCVPELYKFKDQPNGFTFTKTNADGTKTLSGAVFGLYNGETLVYSATAAVDGTVIFSTIAPGVYTLKEKTAPVGYQLSSETHSVLVATNGSIMIDGKASSEFAGYKFKDTRIPNGFTFTKTNVAETKHLTGAEFGLFDGDTKVYSATSTDGTVSFKNIEPGTYTLKETKAPVGYQLSSETHAVVVAEDMSITIDGKPASEFAGYNFNNCRVPNGFKFIKTDEYGEKTLSGALFGLFVSGEDTPAYTTTSGADGIVAFTDIEPGTYTLEEITPPVGFLLTYETHQVVVAEDMSITVDGADAEEFAGYKFLNDPNMLTFTKTDADETVDLSGAIFGLYNENDVLVYSATSAADGTVIFLNIELGTYTLKEVQSPVGYEKSDETHIVVVGAFNAITVDGKPADEFVAYNFKNGRTPNGFQFIKTNADGTKNLSGALFGLYDGDKLVYSVKSDKNGIVAFANIEPGNYTLKEISAPAGYKLSSETHAVVVAEDMSIQVDGNASTSFAAYKFKNKGGDIPKTGEDDSKNIMLGLQFMLLGALLIFINRRKELAEK